MEEKIVRIDYVREKFIFSNKRKNKLRKSNNDHHLGFMVILLHK